MRGELIITGNAASRFFEAMRNPDEEAIRQRDEFISDVNIEAQPNGEIIINCDCDFNENDQRSEICDVLVNIKEENLYDTTNINVESSSKYSASIARLVSNAWSPDSKYTYEERCRYVSHRDEKREMYISNISALAS